MPYTFRLIPHFMSYALITGASKGIGRAIAEELAKRRFNVLLVARSGAALEELSHRLKQQYSIEADFLSIDLAAPHAAKAVYDWCERKNYPVSILVNNAGYGLSGSFESWPLEDSLDMMLVNTIAPVSLCRLFLPRLKQQPRAYILNIASSAAYQAIPYLSLYAATKILVITFSRGLRQELRGSTVSVTCVSPGATDTDFTVRARIGEKGLKAAAKVNMSPEAVARIAVKSMLAGKAEVITGVVNKLGAFMVWLLPKGWVEKTVMKIYQ